MHEQFNKVPTQGIPWILFVIWAWYITFTLEATPLRVATIAAGIAITVTTVLNVSLIFQHFTQYAFYIRLSQLVFCVAGLFFSAGVITASRSSKDTASLLADNFQAVTVPCLICFVGITLFGVQTVIEFRKHAGRRAASTRT